MRTWLEKPHCPRTVVIMFLNIILQTAASAHLLRWPIVKNNEYKNNLTI